MSSHVTGVILAGGRAERLGGIAKGMLEREGRPLVLWIAEALAAVTEGTLLVADDPAPYAGLGLPSIPDAVSGVGPAGGLLAALEHVATPFALVVACDMPGVSSAVLELLRDRDPAFDVVVPVVGGRPEPLCARWSTRAAPAIRAGLGAGTRALFSLLDRVRVDRVPEAALRAADPELRFLANVNTPDDARRWGLAPGAPR